MALANYALVKDGVVGNLACADAATDGGAAWLDAIASSYDTVEDVSAVSPPPQVGWLWLSAGSYLVPTVLATSTPILAADGSNHATITYTDNHTPPIGWVTFDVNGATATEATASGVATVTVTASTAGPIVVTCEGMTITLEAS
jgi:hypothetical protein